MHRNNPHAIRHPSYDHRIAQSSAIMQLLGLKAGGHLPTDGMPPRVIQGVTVWVTPAPAPRWDDRWGKPVLVKSSKHRVMCRCPQCGWEGSVGRLAQHICK